MGEGGFGFGPACGFALEIFLKAEGFSFEALLGFRRDAAFCFQLCQRDAGLGEASGGGHFGLAQGRDAFAGLDAFALAQGVFAGEVFDLALADFELGAGGFGVLARLGPAQMGEKGFEAMDFFGQAPVAAGLGGLALEACELALDLGGDFGEALEIGFGGVELEFRLMAARVEAGDTGGFLKDAAAVLGLGADQFGDLALTHEGGGVGARGGVGEEELDVLAAHGAAVDAVAGACAAFQLALDLKHVGAVEFRRRGAFGVIQNERDFGSFPRGAGGSAGEDEIVHLAAAHGLGGVGPHGPAQRFEKV
jgi:hypothetical protein